MALAAIISGSTAATAATDTTCSPLVAAGTNWGGTYFCNYGYRGDALWNGDYEVWVVAGSAHNVFTRWRNPNGGLSSWVNMGGNVKSNGDTSYLQSRINIYSDRNDEVLRVIGTDGEPYCNVRNGLSGNWNGWTRPHCDVW